MSTTADKLNYLISTKNAIKQAIIDKGVDVSDTDTFRSYADKIVDIQAGSTGGDYDIEVTLNDDGTQSLNVIDASGEKTNKFLQLIEGTENVSLTAQDFGDITEIRQYAFAYATNLVSVVLPNTITLIGSSVFTGCSGLTTMTVLPTTPPTLQNINAISTATTSIYVPDESVDAYKQATNWSNFADIIKPLSEKESV